MTRVLAAALAALILAGCYTYTGERLGRHQSAFSTEETRERILAYRAEEAADQDWLVLSFIYANTWGGREVVLGDLAFEPDELCGAVLAERRPGSDDLSLDGAWRDAPYPESECFSYTDIGAVRADRLTPADRGNTALAGVLYVTAFPFLLPFMIVGLGGAPGG